MEDQIRIFDKTINNNKKNHFEFRLSQFTTLSVAKLMFLNFRGILEINEYF